MPGATVIEMNGKRLYTMGLRDGNILSIQAIDSGGAVLKHHLKNPANAMVSKSLKIMAKRYALKSEVEEPLPDGLKSLLEPMDEKIETYKRMMANNQPIIVPALRLADDEKLGLLKAILAKKGSISSEDKIYKILQVCPHLAG